MRCGSASGLPFPAVGGAAAGFCFFAKAAERAILVAPYCALVGHIYCVRDAVR